MAQAKKADGALSQTAQWPFPAAAAMGSSVRAKGIERELRARLPFAMRGGLGVEAGQISLRLPDVDPAAFESARAIIDKVLADIHALPVLPREAEDILTISARERLRWTGDGRLPSAGTRTVKLRGRAKAVTFHVFDPRRIEDILDADLPSLWREEDAATSIENRARAAGKAARTRAAAKAPASPPDPTEAHDPAETPARQATKARKARPCLKDWAAFEAEGFLR